MATQSASTNFLALAPAQPRPDVSRANPARRMIQGPMLDEWDRHQATIRRLYMEEDRTLKEVMTIMKNEYGFEATVKMYKLRITKWRLDKNNKEHEIAALLRKKAQRDAVGKPSFFRIRGRPVTVEEALRYCRRKGRCFSLPSTGPPTPSDLSCRTPSPPPLDPMSADKEEEDVETISNYASGSAAPLDLQDLVLFSQASQTILQFMAPPQALLVSEKLFATIYAYVRHNLDTGIWYSTEDGFLLCAEPNMATNVDPSDLDSLCVTARLFHAKGSFVESHQATSKLFVIVRDLLVCDIPWTLENIIKCFLDLIERGMHEIASMLRRYIGQMAGIVLPSHHPWRQIFYLISLLDAENFELLIHQILPCVTGAFESELGPLHFRAISSRTSTILSARFSYNVANVANVETQLRQLLMKCTESCGPSDERSQSLMETLADFLNSQGKYDEAEVVMSYAMSCISNMGDSSASLKRLHGLASSQYHQGNETDAEINIRKAIEISEKIYGTTSPGHIRKMVQLEGWLWKWGRDDEAAELQAEIVELLGLGSEIESL